MDVTLNNVLEGTRQYFLGLPKQTQADGSAQPVWSAGAPNHEEGAPAQSGAPAPTSRPPSAAAAPPSTPLLPTVAAPPRPPSEPLEPEPHIIHKATVMREAAEKRKEQPETEDDEEVNGALSPPSHIIHKPPPRSSLPSPAPAPAAPCPSPARPPSTAPQQPTEPPQDNPSSYRPSSHRVQSSEHFTPTRPPDPYSVARPPESYSRYHYETAMPDGRTSQGPSVHTSQPSLPPRHSPQTYARMSSSLPQHTTSRLREPSTASPPPQRYAYAVAPPPPHNDRVPPIHHPQPPQTHSSQRMAPIDGRPSQAYPPVHQRHEPSPYSRPGTHYDRMPSIPPRKYDHQQAYSGYRPIPVTQPVQNHRVETQQHSSYKLSSDLVNPSYAARPLERVPVPVPPAFTHTQEVKHMSRIDYPNMSRTTEGRSGYSYPIPSTSSVRFGPSASTPVQNSSLPSRSTYRTLTTAKSGYDYAGTNQVQTSPARSTVKPGYPSQQPRMTVSVTTLVNQMNQTKQKRESPLDLSVKTVKNSADSSTTQDDSIDSATMENKVLHSRASSGSRQSSSQTVTGTGYVASHKVDFAPDFNQYRERAPTHSISNSLQGGHVPARYNGAYDSQRQLPATVSYPVEARHQAYPDRSKYNAPVVRTDYVQRIDLTRSVTDERHSDSRIRDDRHCIIEERKRPAAPIISNIPEKIVRYETWSADSRIERLNQSAREQQQLMSQPVYSYSSHKQLEAYQNEQKRSVSSSMYQQPHLNHRYPNTSCNPPTGRDYKDYHSHYHPERIPPNNSRHVIQKLPNNNELTHPVPVSPHSGVPANKRVLSILRNSLETKQTGFVEPLRPARQISELIVIDDADDDLEITDLTKDQDIETQGHNLLKTTHTQVAPNKEHHIQMPKAVDSIACDSEFNNCNSETKTKSPESDVSSRIRTKAELKVMPHDSIRVERKLEQTEDERNKPLPKSQKQHLFNQIREDLRLESVIKSENTLNNIIAEVKSEPMNIDEIEKDAQIPIKTEPILNEFEQDLNMPPDDDLDWASACDSFMEQLKTGCPKKKIQRKIIDSFDDNETKADSCPTVESKDIQEPVVQEDTPDIIPAIVIKQEPTEDNVNDIASTSETVIQIQHKDFDVASINVKMEKSTERSENYKETSDDDNIELIKLQTSTNVEEKDSDSKGKRGISQKSQKVFRKKHKNNSLKVGYDKIKNKVGDKTEKRKIDKKCDSSKKGRINNKIKLKKKNLSSSSASTLNIKQEPKDNEIKTVVKEESESTDDDVPLIKSKILKEKETKLLKEKENKDILNYKLLKDLSEKSAYVKLECCDVDMNKNSRKSLDSMIKQTDELQIKGKLTRQNSRLKTKSFSMDSNKLETHNNDSSSDSDDDVTVASRLRLRKNTKNEESKLNHNKTPVKSTSSKKLESSSNSTCSTPVRRPGFGDGSDFYPGWEEELYKYKRSLRMPTRLIAIPRGRSDGPFSKASGSLFTRGSTSLPDLDPAPLSPAPSSAPSAATDDIFARRQDKLTLDSDLESNSSYTAPNRLHYDSEASTSTNFSSSTNNKKRTSIVDVLIQKCGKKEDTRKKIKEKDRDDRTPKLIPKSSNTSELLPTPSLGLVKDGDKGNLSATKEKLMEEIYYLGAFRKETVSTFRNDFINNTNGLIGATEEFAPVMLKTRTRTESRLLKQRATIKEVFGDERPASAPPISCREEELEENKESSPETIIEVKKEPECKPKNKLKKIVKDKIKRRSNSTRDGLRSSNLKKCDAKGRLLRLKKRNNLMNTAPNNKRNREGSIKHKKEETKSPSTEEGVIKEGENIVLPATTDPNKRRFKRLFGRRKLSSGFDYIRKKKKIIRRDQSIKIRRHAPKPSPESAHDILKEIKSWIVKKSEGETHLHKAARLGYTDCVAYCLEKMNAEPSSKDNAGFTPLHVAAAKGHVRIARLLLQYGANVSAAAQGGIRPLHEACENSHVEIIRLLLSYGADPLLGTYAGQTPEELTDGPATTFLRLHLTDVQGKCTEPWKFPSPAEIIDSEELGCDSLLSPPPCSPLPPPDSTLEIQCTEAPLPPFYSLRTSGGQPSDGLWCLLQDITNVLQIKSKESLLKQIHCGSGSPKELLREIRTSEFLERAQCHQLLCAGEKVNVRASKVALVRVTDKLRQLLKIETVLIS